MADCLCFLLRKKGCQRKLTALFCLAEISQAGNLGHGYACLAAVVAAAAAITTAAVAAAKENQNDNQYPSTAVTTEQIVVTHRTYPPFCSIISYADAVKALRVVKT